MGTARRLFEGRAAPGRHIRLNTVALPFRPAQNGRNLNSPVLQRRVTDALPPSPTPKVAEHDGPTRLNGWVPPILGG